MQTLSYQQIIDKIQNFCAYQERSTQEVKQKLKDLGTEAEDIERILNYLREFNFINEERFAAGFARGKFRFKRWGRIKIRQEMRMKGVNNDLIEQVLLDELGDDAAYEQTLLELLAAKSRTIRDKEPFKRNQKLAQAALSRGFESNVVWKVIKNFNPKDKNIDDDSDFEAYEDDF